MSKCLQCIPVICKCTLSPVGAAQHSIAVQAFTLRMQIILSAGVGRIMNQQPVFKVGCLQDTVFQRSGIKRNVRVYRFCDLLGKGRLNLFKSCLLVLCKAGAEYKLHADAVFHAFQLPSICQWGSRGSRLSETADAVQHRCVFSRCAYSVAVRADKRPCTSFQPRFSVQYRVFSTAGSAAHCT
nr:MAG TPA: hypothetical protein [Bacteriophage sp.]